VPWLSIIGLVLAVCALFCCAYLWSESRKKLSSEDVVSKLRSASDELSKDYAKQLRGIETEWTDMYQKFSRLAGRVDKVRGIEQPTAPIAAAPEPPKRSDLLRQRRRRLAA
jgi:hypothetical protein